MFSRISVGLVKCKELDTVEAVNGLLYNIIYHQLQDSLREALVDLFFSSTFIFSYSKM